MLTSIDQLILEIHAQRNTKSTSNDSSRSSRTRWTTKEELLFEQVGKHLYSSLFASGVTTISWGVSSRARPKNKSERSIDTSKVTAVKDLNVWKRRFNEPVERHTLMNNSWRRMNKLRQRARVRHHLIYAPKVYSEA